MTGTTRNSFLQLLHKAVRLDSEERETSVQKSSDEKSGKQTRDYQAVIEQIHASEEEARFIASEKKKRVIYSIPFGIGISLLRRVA